VVSMPKQSEQGEIMNKIDLIIDALELARNEIHDPTLWTDKVDKALAAARELRELKPVAWMTNSEHEYSIDYKFNWLQTPLHDIPLYTAPPRKPWVGLTDEEILSAAEEVPITCIRQRDYDLHFAPIIEAKLKENNGAL